MRRSEGTISSRRCGLVNSNTSRPSLRKKRQGSTSSENFRNQRHNILRRITLPLGGRPTLPAPILLVGIWPSAARPFPCTHPQGPALPSVAHVLQRLVIRRALDQFLKPLFGADHSPYPFRHAKPFGSSSSRGTQNATTVRQYG